MDRRKIKDIFQNLGLLVLGWIVVLCVFTDELLRGEKFAYIYVGILILPTCAVIYSLYVSYKRNTLK